MWALLNESIKVLKGSMTDSEDLPEKLAMLMHWVPGSVIYRTVHLLTGVPASPEDLSFK